MTRSTIEGNAIGRRVVCAAIRSKTHPEMIICGPRHWDLICRAPSKDGWEQGFVDQRGVFMDRKEAWEVAKAAGQIIRICGGEGVNGGRLFSENLY